MDRRSFSNAATHGASAAGEKLLARRELVAEQPIDWWISASPGRQWTASHDPRAVTPAAWYGRHYEPAPVERTSGSKKNAKYLWVACANHLRCYVALILCTSSSLFFVVSPDHPPVLARDSITVLSLWQGWH